MDSMQSKERIALFDFCETLVNFQTADAFVEYVRDRSKNRKMIRKEYFRLCLCRIRLLYVLARLFKYSSINKRLILWQLKGFSKSELEIYAETYYNKVIKSKLIRPVVLQLKKMQDEGWRIIIVSAGYDLYLKYFCREYGIPEIDLISVKIKFYRNICQGSFEDGDRLWDKTKILEKRFIKDNIYTIAFSDSAIDLPMLQWADEGIIVRRSDKKQWSNSYKEIIWEK